MSNCCCCEVRSYNPATCLNRVSSKIYERLLIIGFSGSAIFTCSTIISVPWKEYSLGIFYLYIGIIIFSSFCTLFSILIRVWTCNGTIITTKMSCSLCMIKLISIFLIICILDSMLQDIVISDMFGEKNHIKFLLRNLTTKKKKDEYSASITCVAVNLIIESIMILCITQIKRRIISKTILDNNPIVQPPISQVVPPAYYIDPRNATPNVMLPNTIVVNNYSQNRPNLQYSPNIQNINSPQYPIDNSNPNSDQKIQVILHKNKKNKTGFKKKNKKENINSSSQTKIN